MISLKELPKKSWFRKGDFTTTELIREICFATLLLPIAVAIAVTCIILVWGSLIMMIFFMIISAGG